MKNDDDELTINILALIGEHTDKHGKALKLLRLNFNNDLELIGVTREWKYPKAKKSPSLTNKPKEV